MKIKLFCIISLFPLAINAQSEYTEAVNTISKVLYENSRERKDLEAGVKYVRDNTPEYIVRPMEILLPTLDALRRGKFELRYARSF